MFFGQEFGRSGGWQGWLIEEFINPTHPWSLLDTVMASVPPHIFMKGGGIGVGGLEMGRLMQRGRQEGSAQVCVACG